VIRSLVVVLGVVVTVPVAGAVASTDRHVSHGMAQRFLPWTALAAHDHLPVTNRSAPPQPDGQATAVAHLSPPQSTSSPLTVPSSPSSAVPLSSPPRHRLPVPPVAPAGVAGAAVAGTTLAAAAPLADLRLTITAPSRVAPGATYLYTIRVANHGPATPSEVTVRNTLPTGVTRTGARLPKGVGGYAGAHEATLVLPKIAPGRSMVMALKVRANRTTHGQVTAHSKIVYTAGARLTDPKHATAKATTHIA
jgi:uncharacterized repeat protein (TIGR01451 family)